MGIQYSKSGVSVWKRYKFEDTVKLMKLEVGYLVNHNENG
jgi:hypothetical protein